MSIIANKKRAPFWAGFVATLPVAVGCAPFGVAYGAAAAATLPLWQTSLMSVAVFAGTAQFIAASMLAQGSTWLPVLVTCALVNLRLVLLSAAISPHVRGAGLLRRTLAAQMPVLSWWALAVVLTRTSTTLTVLAIIVVGTLLQINGQATIGEMVTFMNFAGLIIARLEGAVGFINRVMSEAPRLREFFQVCDTVPAIGDRPDAVDPGRLEGLAEPARRGPDLDPPDHQRRVPAGDPLGQGSRAQPKILVAGLGNLLLRDDGVGVERPDRLAPYAEQGRLGMIGMEQRVVSAGGIMSVVSHPGRGTRLRATVPYAASAEVL